MPEQLNVGPTQKRMTDLLMLTDAPWVATVIMGISQPFAQLRETIGLPVYMPLVVAVVASLLVAAYWVNVEQRAKPAQSLLIIPVVAMMLFSASIGANNVVKAAAAGKQSTSDTTSAAQRADSLQQQNDLLQQQLDIEKKKTALLGAPKGSQGMNTSSLDGTAAEHTAFLSRISAWLSATAYAQPAGSQQNQHLTSEQRKKLEELDKEQKALEEKQQELKAREQRGESGATPAPLWKSF
jgi:hypothetical protein